LIRRKDRAYNPTMLSTGTDRWRDRTTAVVGVLLLWLLILGFFLIGTYSKARRPGGYDVHCFLSTARAIRAGTDPYHLELPIPYNYPLFAATAAITLTFLPESVVHGAWFAATLAAWIAVAVLLVTRWTRATGLPCDRGVWAALGLSSLLLLGPIQNHLLNGQTDAFVLLSCVLFWLSWHEGRPGWAAFWLGLGVSLKLVPALFFVPLVVRRSWSVLAGACGWIVLLSVVLPGLFLGTGVLTAYEHYGRTVLLAELSTSIHSAQYPHNYTVGGALTWLVPAWQGLLSIKVLAALLVVVPLCAIERGEPSPVRTVARLEAYLAGILLLAPLSQPHHLTLLLPAVWLLALRWLSDPERSWRGKLLGLVPYALFPLWKVLGGPLEVLGVGWIFVGALGRAGGWRVADSHGRLTTPTSSAMVTFCVRTTPR
jgi:hypothetical protein